MNNLTKNFFFKDRKKTREVFGFKDKRFNNNNNNNQKKIFDIEKKKMDYSGKTKAKFKSNFRYRNKTFFPSPKNYIRPEPFDDSVTRGFTGKDPFIYLGGDYIAESEFNQWDYQRNARKFVNYDLYSQKLWGRRMYFGRFLWDKRYKWAFFPQTSFIGRRSDQKFSMFKDWSDLEDSFITGKLRTSSSLKKSKISSRKRLFKLMPRVLARLRSKRFNSLFSKFKRGGRYMPSNANDRVLLKYLKFFGKLNKNKLRSEFGEFKSSYGDLIESVKNRRDSLKVFLKNKKLNNFNTRKNNNRKTYDKFVSKYNYNNNKKHGQSDKKPGKQALWFDTKPHSTRIHFEGGFPQRFLRFEMNFGQFILFMKNANFVKLALFNNITRFDLGYDFFLNFYQVKNPTAFLLGMSIRRELEQKKYLFLFINSLIYNLNQKVNYEGLSGFKISVSGRWARGSRSRVHVKRTGEVPLSDVNAFVDYFSTPVVLKYGVCAVKVWLFFENLSESFRSKRMFLL